MVAIDNSLSNPTSLRDLQLVLNRQKDPLTMSIEFGDVVVFPSFTLHQITPITKGIRYSLVSWVSGPSWR